MGSLCEANDQDKQATDWGAPSTQDFFGKVGLKVAFGLVICCCSHHIALGMETSLLLAWVHEHW